MRASVCAAGAIRELLRETGAYFCVKENEGGDVPLNLGGTTRAFVPLAAGLFLLSCKYVLLV